MKLIIGLGNFPKQYAMTKHNVGFQVIDEFCKKHNISLDNENFKGIFYKTPDYIIAKPLTLMNLSGLFVREVIKFYKINIEDVLIIYDDINLDIGLLKLKTSGTSGGQNGIQNIIDLLGTEKIKRLKIGIGKNKQGILADYVLSNFSKQELTLLKPIFIKTNEIIHEFIKDEDFNKIMTKWN
ncbi:MAG: aminoacyl-tRNA hydrolase [Mycoplasmataceae bacterium]|nr:aminoacyl-tRNA hydrolase [Mycoplasmataceae bacterium]